MKGGIERGMKGPLSFSPVVFHSELSRIPGDVCVCVCMHREISRILGDVCVIIHPELSRILVGLRTDSERLQSHSCTENF